MTTGAAPPALPPEVLAALADPVPGRERWVDAPDRRWFALEWGSERDRPLVLVHGVTSDSGTFWRLGPALAATGRHVVAVDLPGHGRTGGWRGRHRYVETAQDLGGFLAAANLLRPDLEAVGHSWGAHVVASLPAADITPRVLVLIDPPALTPDQLQTTTHDPEEQPVTDAADARRAAALLRAAHPGWAEGDVRAKAEALQRFEPDAVKAVLMGNDFDAGVAALGHPAARGIPAWYIVGEWAAGGLIPDIRMADCVGRVGRDHVITITGADHSPHRSHIEPTIAAILRAIA